MKTIWKFSLKLTNGIQTVSMPVGSKVVHFEMQQGAPAIWALVDSVSPVENRMFEILGTGHEIGFDRHWAGTCQDGVYVWHLFEFGRKALEG